MAQTREHEQSVERRKQWRDRRNGIDRRCLARCQHESYECRSGTPRRQADIDGEQFDGEIWWSRSSGGEQ